MSGERFDATNEPARDGLREKPVAAGRGLRPFLGINFACCTVYGRIYVNRQGTAFLGNCPRCGRRITVEIDPEGPNDRFFSVS